MSITLAASQVSSMVVGGVTVESDANYAVTSVVADYVSNELRVGLKGGTTTGQSFAPGQIPPTYDIIINGVTGAWRITGTNLSGVLAGAALTNIQTIFKTLRNNAETFAVNQNLFPGASLVAWT